MNPNYYRSHRRPAAAPAAKKSFNKLWPLGIVLICLIWIFWPSKDKPAPPSKQPAQPAAQTFNKQQHSLTDPASLWVVVNKKRALSPANYVPTNLVVPSVLLRVPDSESMQLRADTAAALKTMFVAADAAGVPLMLSSGYRSYDYQVNLYNGYVMDEGQVQADKASARPGFSEHQTGLSLDIEPADKSCEVQACFADTSAGKWLAANAWQYGFLLRYPADKTAITGYEFEPWHFRYIGKELAAEMHARGITTLEEFFGLPAAPNY